MTIPPITAAILGPTITSAPFHPSSSDVVAFLWQKTVTIVSVCLSPFRPLYNRIFFLSWQTTALLLLAGAIALLFENHFASLRGKELAAELLDLKKGSNVKDNEIKQLKETLQTKNDELRIKTENLEKAKIELDKFHNLLRAAENQLELSQQELRNLNQQYLQSQLLTPPTPDLTKELKKNYTMLQAVVEPLEGIIESIPDSNTSSRGTNIKDLIAILEKHIQTIPDDLRVLERDVSLSTKTLGASFVDLGIPIKTTLLNVVQLLLKEPPAQNPEQIRLLKSIKKQLFNLVVNLKKALPTQQDEKEA